MKHPIRPAAPFLPIAAGLALLSVAAIPAQGPAFQVFSRPLVRFGAYRVQELLAQWPESRIGRLCQDAEVRPLIDKLVEQQRRRLLRRHAVRLAALQVQLDLEPWRAAQVYSCEPDPFDLLHFGLAQVDRTELLWASLGTSVRQQSVAAAISCLPRYEGRWTRTFELEIAQLRKSPFLRRDPDARIGGFPVDLFSPPADEDLQPFLADVRQHRWLVHLPGTFVYGSGELEPLEQLPPAPPAERAEAALTVDLEGIAAAFANRGGTPWEFATLGLDALQSLQWRLGFVDGLVLDELTITTDGEPGGLIGALLRGKAEPPPQALPDGALAQIRASIDLEILCTAFDNVPRPKAPPAELLAAIAKAFDGGIAIGCTTPPPGNLIPGLFVTAGVADPDALDALLREWVIEVLPTKQIRIDGIACTVVQLPDLPPALHPALCHIDDTVYLAETARSLRALLQCRDAGAVAMPVGDAPLPPGQGEIVPNLELRVAEARLYETLYELWLPLYERTVGATLPGSARRREMPEPEVVAAYCGHSRGVLRCNGDRYTLAHFGTFGGPELTALAMAWAPMIAPSLHDWTSDMVAFHYARHRLAPVWAVFQAFRDQHGRWPVDLAELFAHGNLPDDALLLPGEDATETVRLADGRTIRSSFRYFPKPVRYDGHLVLLLEIQPRHGNRAALGVQGPTPESYSEANRLPIDHFGKGASPSVEPSAGRDDHR